MDASEIRVDEAGRDNRRPVVRDSRRGEHIRSEGLQALRVDENGGRSFVGGHRSAALLGQSSANFGGAPSTGGGESAVRMRSSPAPSFRMPWTRFGGG